MYSSANGFCSCNLMFNTIIIQSLCRFIIKTNFHIIIFGIVYFWSACAWRHIITSLFEFHKFIILNGTQKVKYIFIYHRVSRLWGDKHIHFKYLCVTSPISNRSARYKNRMALLRPFRIRSNVDN